MWRVANGLDNADLEASTSQRVDQNYVTQSKVFMAETSYILDYKYVTKWTIIFKRTNIKNDFYQQHFFLLAF